MSIFESNWNPQTPLGQQRSNAMEERMAGLRALEQRAADASTRSLSVFKKRGQLLPRQRVALLLDPGSPWLPLASLAGYQQDVKDADKSVPGGSIIAGIGFVNGVRCMVVASDSGIDAGALLYMGMRKILRAQTIALQNKLPFIHLVESAGGNLLTYTVDGFVQAGEMFRNLAKLSAAGLPVITIQHGSGTAGGAYMPGLSDVVIMVRGRSRAFLAGPPLLKAATGEVATEEELGGAEMHASVSGLGEYLAEDDRHALDIAREIVARTGFAKVKPRLPAKPPRYDAEELLGLMPAHHREPVNMREIIARLVDDSDMLEFKPLFGSATICIQASIEGHAVGIISNNGPLDVAGANKATHFIQLMCQLGQPLIYLQNITGFMVGKDSEQNGMIKHGGKMIQAVTNATVPQITIQCGASFGAGNYGMCGRAYEPRFLFSWPSARTAIMGGEQAARTMQIVTDAAMARKGITPDPLRSQTEFDKISSHVEDQADVFITSGLLLDDGVIDPRDTRSVLRQCLDMCAESEIRELRPVQFGVARM